MLFIKNCIVFTQSLYLLIITTVYMVKLFILIWCYSMLLLIQEWCLLRYVIYHSGGSLFSVIIY